jgi:hypothetical protein
MIELLSIHLPKTGGTSFYQILQQVYGDNVSIPFKRQDYQRCLDTRGALLPCLDPGIRVVHGHLRYREVEPIIAAHIPKLILWLRDPIDRIISNYHFFIDGLKHPERNPAVYEENKHRLNETLEEYAALKENQNRIHDFLDGARLEDFFFIGFLEHFDADLQYLAKLLEWPEFHIPHANQGKRKLPSSTDHQTLYRLRKWNALDLNLYQEATVLRQKRLNPSQL